MTIQRPAGECTLPADCGTNPAQPWGLRADGGARVPWTVTVAALIAFAFAILKVLVALLAVDILKHWDLIQPHTHHSRGHFYFVLLMSAIFGLSLLWGGFAAWRGLGARPLFLAAIGLVSFEMVAPVVESPGHAGWVLSWYDFALVILALLATRSSKEFFRAQTAPAPESATRRA